MDKALVYAQHDYRCEIQVEDMERAIALVEHLSMTSIPFDLNISKTENSHDDSETSWEMQTSSVSFELSIFEESEFSADSCDDSDTMSSIDDNGSCVSTHDLFLDFDSRDPLELMNEHDPCQHMALSDSLFTPKELSKALQIQLHLNSISNRAITLFHEFLHGQIVYFLRNKPSW